MTNNIAIIGCGAIGYEIAKSIDNQNIPNGRVLTLFDAERQKLNLLEKDLINKPEAIFDKFDDFVTSAVFDKIDFVIEAASIEAAKRYSALLLEKGKDLMIMSTGSFSDPTFSKDILYHIRNRGRRVYLPSGAIGGADILRAVKGYVDDVILITTKGINSIKGAPFFLKRGINPETIVRQTTIFDGSAEEAIKEFPSNINVSALVSLAGIGFHKTKVRVVVDPNIETNQHEIKVKWKFGEFYIKVNNRPSPSNPKTSYLAVLSAIECLRSALINDIQIGS